MMELDAPTLEYAARTAIRWLSYGIVSVGIGQTFMYLLQVVLASIALARDPPLPSRGFMWSTLSDVSLPVTVIVPAYNEEATIVSNVHSMMSLEYPDFEIIVVNDGASDRTLEKVVAAFGLHRVERAYKQDLFHQPINGIYASARYPNLIVVDKVNGGKADALNAGINLSRNPVFCAIDADSLLEADSLLRAIQPFVDDPVRVVAVGGTIRIVNGCEVTNGRVTRVGLPRNLLELFQTVEYLRAFLIGRLAWSQIRALTIVSGAFGIFRRDVAVAIGGYKRDTIGEDMEIVVNIHRRMRELGRDYRIEFVAEPVCWTQAPGDLKTLGTQRVRWQRGTMETFFRHKRMLFNPRYGRVGIIGMGQTFLADVLGPLAELAGYILLPMFWYFGLLDFQVLAAFMALTVIFGIFFSVSSLILEEMELRRIPGAGNLARMFLAAIVENFGYRQLMSYYRIVGTLRHLRGTASAWNPIPRTAFNSSMCQADQPK